VTRLHACCAQVATAAQAVHSTAGGVAVVLGCCVAAALLVLYVAALVHLARRPVTQRSEKQTEPCMVTTAAPEDEQGLLNNARQ
jgi:hypothetical protein